MLYCGSQKQIQLLGKCLKKSLITITKHIFDIMVSTAKNRFMPDNIKNVYIDNTMEQWEYTTISIKLISQEIIEDYDVMPYPVNGYVCFDANKGMYDLLQELIMDN